VSIRSGFRDQLRRNRWKLRLLLLAVFVLTALAGRTLGRGVQVVSGDAYARDGDAFRERAWYRRYPNQLAVALVVLVFVQYLRLRRRGDLVVLSLVGARPLQDARLGNVLDEMSIAAGIRPPRLHVLEDPSLNAFACGAGERHAVVVTRGLLERLERDELQAVVAHEVAHVRNGDTTLMTVLFGMSRVLTLTASLAFGPLVTIFASARDGPAEGASGEDAPAPEPSRPKRRLPAWKTALLIVVVPLAAVLVAALGTAISVLAVAAFFLVLRFLPWIALALAAWELARLVRRPDDGAPARKRGRWRAALMFAPVGLVAGPAIVLLGAVFPFAFLLLRLAVSRNQEFAADATAVALTRHPAGLAGALRKLRADHAPATALPRTLSPLAIARVGDRSPGPEGVLRRLRALFATHPPLEERLARLEEMGAPAPATRRAGRRRSGRSRRTRDRCGIRP